MTMLTLKKVSDLTEQELCLVMARDEYPSYIIHRVGCDVNGNDVLQIGALGLWVLDWQTIGPRWEREADNVAEFHLLRKARGQYEDGHSSAYESFMASRTPESIARAITEMRHPQGVSL